MTGQAQKDMRETCESYPDDLQREKEICFDMANQARIAEVNYSSNKAIAAINKSHLDQQFDEAASCKVLPVITDL